MSAKKKDKKEAAGIAEAVFAKAAKKSPAKKAAAMARKPSGPRTGNDYGISRIDQPEKKNHCWNVRVPFSAGKCFSDSKHDGRDGALTAARTYRDACVAALHSPVRDRVQKLMERRA